LKHRHHHHHEHQKQAGHTIPSSTESIKTPSSKDDDPETAKAHHSLKHRHHKQHEHQKQAGHAIPSSTESIKIPSIKDDDPETAKAHHSLKHRHHHHHEHQKQAGHTIPSSTESIKTPSSKDDDPETAKAHHSLKHRHHKHQKQAGHTIPSSTESIKIQSEPGSSPQTQRHALMRSEVNAASEAESSSILPDLSLIAIVDDTLEKIEDPDELKHINEPQADADGDIPYRAYEKMPKDNLCAETACGTDLPCQFSKHERCKCQMHLTQKCWTCKCSASRFGCKLDSNLKDCAR